MSLYLPTLIVTNPCSACRFVLLLELPLYQFRTRYLVLWQIANLGLCFHPPGLFSGVVAVEPSLEGSFGLWDFWTLLAWGQAPGRWVRYGGRGGADVSEFGWPGFRITGTRGGKAHTLNCESRSL